MSAGGAVSANSPRISRSPWRLQNLKGSVVVFNADSEERLADVVHLLCNELCGIELSELAHARKETAAASENGFLRMRTTI